MELEERLKNAIIKTLEDKKAMDVTCLKLNGKTELAEYMIFASGSSSKNIKALADAVRLELKNNFGLGAHMEGLDSAKWVLVDIGNIIVHIFDKEARNIFKLEDKFSGKEK